MPGGPTNVGQITLEPVPVLLYSLTSFGDHLRVVDPATGTTVSSVAISLHGSTVTGGTALATLPVTRELWAALTIGGQSRLVTIDPTTGVASPIGNTEDLFDALAFDSAGMLCGVTRDDADTPETLYRLSTVNATPSFVPSLGPGGFGEASTFKPDDGLLYHASGLSDQIFGSIDPDSLRTTDFPLLGDRIDEPFAMTYQGSGVFLMTDLEFLRFGITTGGEATFIGVVDHQSKGLACR